MPRVLLAEDDRDVRMLMEHVLVVNRYQVDAVGTASAARMLLARQRYDLVLTDGALPDGTGLDVAHDAQRRGFPVMVITAYAFILPKEELARFEVLLKPVRPAELLQAVQRMLGTEHAPSDRLRTV